VCSDFFLDFQLFHTQILWAKYIHNCSRRINLLWMLCVNFHNSVKPLYLLKYLGIYLGRKSYSHRRSNSNGSLTSVRSRGFLRLLKSYKYLSSPSQTHLRKRSWVKSGCYVIREYQNSLDSNRSQSKPLFYFCKYLIWTQASIRVLSHFYRT